MTGFTRRTVMTPALIAPNTRPTPMTAATDMATEPVFASTSAATTEVTPAMAPTLMSRPRETMTMVCPTAITPTSAIF